MAFNKTDRPDGAKMRRPGGIRRRKKVCVFCGKEFESRNKQQSFCSHDCYIRNRFWRQEDAEEIFNMLLSGKKVQKVPKWMKDLLLD